MGIKPSGSLPTVQEIIPFKFTGTQEKTFPFYTKKEKPYEVMCPTSVMDGMGMFIFRVGQRRKPL